MRNWNRSNDYLSEIARKCAHSKFHPDWFNEMSTRKKPPFDHSGSSLNSFLDEECNPNEVDAKEGIRQGLEDEKNGRLRPAREFFAEFEARHGISHD